MLFVSDSVVRELLKSKVFVSEFAVTEDVVALLAVALLSVAGLASSGLAVSVLISSSLVTMVTGHAVSLVLVRSRQPFKEKEKRTARTAVPICFFKSLNFMSLSPEVNDFSYFIIRARTSKATRNTRL